MKVVTNSALAALAMATVVVAQTTGAAAAPVVTVVRVPKPWIAPKALVPAGCATPWPSTTRFPG
ncbi:MAG: hypothetical protein ING70_01230 [Rhodocyclaceae bacterium]|nr:hypothetical protein [Rhodocyclaceae bacterium]MCA3133265.1 hypothetical protein [Rhodocyclaceae bacterium]MCA3144263.1 hypothetical protein [Rhodocyclaceae bacterium]